jgi:hypothetical protein
MSMINEIRVNEIRRSLSDTLLRLGAERSLERQQLERRLAAAGPDAPGYQSSMAAMSYARVWESTVLWVGWRLQPRAELLR